MIKCTWSTQEVEILREMVGAHKSVEEICKVLTSRNAASIRNKMGDMGLKFPETSGTIDMEAFKKLMKGANQKCV